MYTMTSMIPQSKPVSLHYKSLGALLKACNEAVRGDMGSEMLKSRRGKAKLKWWYELPTMPQDRYPKQLFS